MVWIELTGLIIGLVVAFAAYRASRIRITVPMKLHGASEKGKEEAEFEFEFDNIFKLKLKSKSSAQAIQWALVAVLFAVAFVIVAIGLRSLGVVF